MLSLREAAEYFHVDAKTLRKKCDRLGITPVPDPRDKRTRLLTAEQVRQLASDTHLSRGGGGTISPLESLAVEIVRERTQQIEQQASQLDLRSSELDRREQALKDKEASARAQSIQLQQELVEALKRELTTDDIVRQLKEDLRREVLAEIQAEHAEAVATEDAVDNQPDHRAVAPRGNGSAPFGGHR
jgi:hypothetical protein